ncbi:MAG: glycosyltransferase family 4 protein [Eubacteriales bacterium]|nr:glycosyltransferase family 4 protein [Eubacteriales bacterium]
MKLLWLCNAVPGVVASQISGRETGAVNWVDHVLSDLRSRGQTICILCPGNGASGALDGLCSYQTYVEGRPDVYKPALEAQFRQVLCAFQPDVIHIWGTEYGHTLAMVNAAQQEGLLPRLAVSIQGLCSVAARHYAQGIPHTVRGRFTLRDFLRQDNIRQQARVFARRGALEVEALKKVRHVIGRTEWDLACTGQINPGRSYHFCSETLREPFYAGCWAYEACRKHRIFAPSCAYPVKGFHYLLEAFAQVLKVYPDATLAVPGKSFLRTDAKYRLRRGSYDKYLAKLVKQYGLQGKIEFLGKLSAEGMKAANLSANVFVQPSTIENSPNALGEAMVLGVPCIASDVGGVTSLMTHGTEGFIYDSAAPYMLAHYICKVFAMGDKAEALGRAARAHAQLTHDPENNLEALLSIYEKLAGEGRP